MANRYGMGARAKAGVVGGVLAGMAMGLVAMIRATSLGLGFWLPMKLISGLFWGVDAVIGGAGIILVGMMIHMAMAGGSGMLFGLAVGDRLNALTAALVGMVWGIAIWAVTTWLVLPWANEVMLERQMVAPGWWFSYHLVFGAILFLVPTLVRAFGERRVPARAGVARPATG